MFKKNQNVKVTAGPAENLVGKIISYEKDHPSGLPWLVKSPKNTSESKQVFGRFKTAELAPIVRSRKTVDKSVGKE